jgi:hypothetical protein
MLSQLVTAVADFRKPTGSDPPARSARLAEVAATDARTKTIDW